MPEELDVKNVQRNENRTPDEIQADLALARGKLKQVEAHTRKLLAEASAAESEAEVMAIHRDKAVDQREAEKASDLYNKIYYFTKDVNQATVASCVDRLTYWSRTSPGCDIEIVFNSPGGSVIDGMALFDFIQTIRRKGHKVTTTALGVAASMAGILLQAGDVRRMGKEAWVLIHQASFGAVGSYGEVEDRLKWVEKVQERILDIFSGRAASSKAEHPMTRRAIKKNWERKDWWISSDDCLKHGFVDEVL